MINRIKTWWWRRKTLKQLRNARQELETIRSTFIPTAHITAPSFGNANTMTLSYDGEPIFSVNANGEAIWHKEETFNQAAEVFLDSVNWKIESTAGIIQSRQDWEKMITEKLISASEKNNGTLTTEELTKVVRKCIMYSKLKGHDHKD